MPERFSSPESDPDEELKRKIAESIEVGRGALKVSVDEKSTREWNEIFFSFADIYLVVCDIEGLDPADLRPVEIHKDKNEVVMAMAIQVVEEKAYQQFGGDTYYYLEYPARYEDDEVDPEHPEISRLIITSQEDEESEDVLLAEYKFGKWERELFQ